MQVAFLKGGTEEAKEKEKRRSTMQAEGVAWEKY